MDYRHYDFPDTVAAPVHREARTVGLGLGGWIAIVVVAALIGAAVAVFLLMRSSSDRAHPPVNKGSRADNDGDPGHGHHHGRGDNTAAPDVDARWRRARITAHAIRHAMQTWQARNSGSLPGLARGMTAREFADTLRFDVVEYLGDNPWYDPESFVLAELDADRGEYVIEVRSSSPDGPRGVYRLDEQGNEEFRRD